MKIELSRIVAIDSLIKLKATGTPDKFASRIGVSKRTLHNTLGFMKSELKAPIYYNKLRESYCYDIEGSFIFTFQKNLS